MISTNDLGLYLQQILDDYISEAQAACDLATAVVEAHCRRTFTQVVDDTLVTRWRPRIVFPSPPVTEVTSVKVDGVLTSCDYDASGNIWPSIQGNQIEIVYTHGFTEIPDAVRLVALRIAARIFKNPTGRVSYSVDSASYQMAQDVSPRIITGDEMVMLRRYRLMSAQ
jgi:hypothetical protein